MQLTTITPNMHATILAVSVRVTNGATKFLNPDRMTVSAVRDFSGYFQRNYFQNDYFQVGLAD